MSGTTVAMETDVAVLRNESARHTKSIEKLELAIEKMGEISNSVARMLAIHEERLAASQNADRDITDLVERRRIELTTEIKGLRVSFEEFKKEVGTDIQNTEERIKQALAEAVEKLTQQIATSEKTQEFEALDKRLTNLESWRWYLIGAFGGMSLILYFAKEIIATFK